MSDDFGAQIVAEIPRLRRYAHSLVRGDGADDLVQQTLMRGLQKRNLWISGTNLRAWLFTLMHNQYVNTVRNAARTTNNHVPIDDVMIALPQSQESALDTRDVEVAVDGLPPDQRQVLLLIGVAQLSYEAVADMMKVPVGTVRSRLSRARAALRERLAA